MSAKIIFVSHSGKDAGVVSKIREALESLGLGMWTDSRQLNGGDELELAICIANDDSRHLVAVLSPHAVSSRWVAKGIQYALKVKKKHTDGFEVVPILLDDIDPAPGDRVRSIVRSRGRAVENLHRGYAVDGFCPLGADENG
jgi:hypothetical protein